MLPKMVYTRATARPVYTHAEILECDYHELWDKASADDAGSTCCATPFQLL